MEAVLHSAPAAARDDESCREQVAGPSGIDDALYGSSEDFDPLSALDGDGALGTARND